jgi:hypothetical protein
MTEWALRLRLPTIYERNNMNGLLHQCLQRCSDPSGVRPRILNVLREAQ